VFKSRWTIEFLRCRVWKPLMLEVKTTTGEKSKRIYEGSDKDAARKHLRLCRSERPRVSFRLVGWTDGRS
jgi:hypothetical protein